MYKHSRDVNARGSVLIELAVALPIIAGLVLGLMRLSGTMDFAFRAQTLPAELGRQLLHKCFSPWEIGPGQSAEFDVDTGSYESCLRDTIESIETVELAEPFPEGRFAALTLDYDPADGTVTILDAYPAELQTESRYIPSLLRDLIGDLPVTCNPCLDSLLSPLCNTIPYSAIQAKFPALNADSTSLTLVEFMQHSTGWKFKAEPEPTAVCAGLGEINPNYAMEKSNARVASAVF
jgi:hypothetical protein